MTLLEIIRRAADISQVALDSFPHLSAESLAEAHLEVVYAQLARRYAAEGKVGLLARKSKTVAFTNGTATLTADVLISCLDDSSLKDLMDSTKWYAYRANPDDAIDDYERRLGYYFMRDLDSISVIEPDAEYDPSSGLTGNLTLTCPCVWDIPSNLDTDIDVPQEVAGDLIDMLAERLRSEVAEKEIVAV